jgi:hypothetical protein
VATLADTGDDYTAFDGDEPAHCLIEGTGQRAVELFGELSETFRLEIERSHC